MRQTTEPTADEMTLLIFMMLLSFRQSITIEKRAILGRSETALARRACNKTHFLNILRSANGYRMKTASKVRYLAMNRRG